MQLDEQDAQGADDQNFVFDMNNFDSQEKVQSSTLTAWRLNECPQRSSSKALLEPKKLSKRKTVAKVRKDLSQGVLHEMQQKMFKTMSSLAFDPLHKGEASELRTPAHKDFSLATERDSITISRPNEISSELTTLKSKAMYDMTGGDNSSMLFKDPRQFFHKRHSNGTFPPEKTKPKLKKRFVGTGERRREEVNITSSSNQQR